MDSHHSSIKKLTYRPSSIMDCMGNFKIIFVYSQIINKQSTENSPHMGSPATLFALFSLMDTVKYNLCLKTIPQLSSVQTESINMSSIVKGNQS